jgi:hypothetical protein
MKGIALIGITGAGKSTLFGRLREAMPGLGFDSFLVFSSYYAQNRAQYRGDLDAEEACRQMLDHLLGLLDQADAMEPRESPRREIGFLLETFLFNMILEFDLEIDRFRHYEERYRDRGGKVVFLKVSEEMVLEGSVTSTRRYRSPRWSQYLDSLGKSDAELAAMYIERQRSLEALVQRSTLDVLHLDTSAGEWDRYLNHLVQYLKS